MKTIYLTELLKHAGVKPEVKNYKDDNVYREKLAKVDKIATALEIEEP